ncbi:hypothetical protein HYI19_07360 [Clostridium botulinum]|uniref:hypothetical protein n=1 Tax=Clostridium botulinum TaxID=1491 RepID=UPI001C9AF1F6|nr:hypothetical protein [Clostridium botulinum]MBY6844619.1 hypothetical protein [Clostridium botulinum]
MRVIKGCKGCTHYVLQVVIGNHRQQLLWKPACMAIQCIKGGKIKNEPKENI